MLLFNLGLFASKTYLDLNGVPKTAEDLDNHKLIIFENYNIPFNHSDNWALNVGRRSDNKRNPYLIINSVPMTFIAAKLGLGIAVLARESYYLSESDLIEVLPSIKSPQLKIYYVYHEYNKNNEIILALKEHLFIFSESQGWIE